MVLSCISGYSLRTITGKLSTTKTSKKAEQCNKGSDLQYDHESNSAIKIVDIHMLQFMSLVSMYHKFKLIKNNNREYSII